MKTSLKLALALSAVAAAKPEKDTQTVVALAKGFLHGALDAEGFTDIEKCIQDAETVVQDAEAAYTDFKAKDIADVIKGFKEVADALKTIKAAMSDCSSTKADWEKLEKIAELFADPKSLIWHVGKDVVVNGKDITHEIATAITDYEAKNWEDFGYQCGEAAAQVFVGEESQAFLKQEKKEHVAKFYQGILENYGGHFNLEALLVCIGDEDQALLMVDVAVQAFEEAIQKKEWQDAIGGIIAVVGAVQEFKQGLPACKAIDTTKFDYKQFSDNMDIAIHPIDHFKLINDDLEMHGQSVLKDIGAGVKAYRSGDFHTFGKEMGKIMKIATEAHAEELAAKPKTFRDVYPKDNREMVTDVAQGFLEATKVGTFNFTNLLLCIYEADQSALDLYESVEILEEAWKDKDWQEAIGGVIGLVAFVQGIEQTLPVCKAVDAKSLDWTNVDTITKLSHDKKKTFEVVGENMVFNGVTITSEFMSAMQAWDAKDYKKFGGIMGQTLMLATQYKEGMFLY